MARLQSNAAAEVSDRKMRSAAMQKDSHFEKKASNDLSRFRAPHFVMDKANVISAVALETMG